MNEPQKAKAQSLLSPGLPLSDVFHHPTWRSTKVSSFRLPRDRRAWRCHPPTPGESCSNRSVFLL